MKYFKVLFLANSDVEIVVAGEIPRPPSSPVDFVKMLFSNVNWLVLKGRLKRKAGVQMRPIVANHKVLVGVCNSNFTTSTSI